MPSYSEEQRSQARQRQAAAQAQVQRRLQSGGGVNLYSANPLEAAVQGIGSFFGITKPPTAYAAQAQAQGQNRLVVPGGWADRSNMPGNVNVAGRTWNLAQQGSNAVYIPQGATTQSNTIVRGAGSVPPAPTLPPPSNGRPTGADLAAAAETSRIAQLTAQDPELQRYEKARAEAKASGDQTQMNSARDIGMQIWASRHPELASKVKPGQSGYDAIQNQLNAGQMGAPMELGAFAGTQPTELLFNPSSPLGAAPPAGRIDYTQVAPTALGGQAPGIMGSYFNNQQQAKMFSRFQGAAPAQTGMNPGLAPGSPYAQAAAAAGGASYAGATGLQPMGSSLTQGANPFASEQAQQQAEEFKKRLLSVQK